MDSGNKHLKVSRFAFGLSGRVDRGTGEVAMAERSAESIEISPWARFFYFPQTGTLPGDDLV